LLAALPVSLTETSQPLTQPLSTATTITQPLTNTPFTLTSAFPKPIATTKPRKCTH